MIKKIENYNIHQNPAINKNEFDIENYLNVNWNKTKEVVNNNADELESFNTNKVDKEEGKGLSTEDFTTEYKQKLDGLENYNDTEIKEDIKDIQQEQIEQDKDIDKIKSNLINLTAEGKSIHVEDAGDLEAKLEVLGNVEQETRSGKNLAKTVDLTTTIKGITFTVKNGEITLNGTANAQIIRGDFKSIFPKFDLEAGTYTFSTTYVSGSRANASSFAKTITNGSDTTIFSNTDSADTQSKEITAETGNYIAFGCAQGAQFTNYKIKLQLEKGNNKTEWEQYGASPSPEFPAEVKTLNTSTEIKIKNEDETQTQTFNLLVQEEMLTGDYFVKEEDGWKEVHNWGKYKFTGDENFTKRGVYNALNTFSIAQQDLTFEYKLQEYEKSGVSNVFKTGKSISYVSDSTVQEGIQLYYNTSNTSKAFYLSAKEFETVEELKAKIKEIDFEFYYIKPTITKLPCTEEQIAVLEQLNKLIPYKPVTNIITIEDIAKLRLNYIADTKTYIDNKYNNLAQQILEIAGGN